jgi:NAD(P)-dependent dehydrogenase (short-subunit alcohol dehydrogenase family)
MTQKSYDNQLLRYERTKRTMLNRWGESKDLLGASIFLLSNASSYITASTINVDGGWLAKGF